MADERVFLDEGGVKVTNARIVVPGKTYAMSTVSSVSTKTHKKSNSGGWALLVVGVAMLAGGLVVEGTNIVLIVLGLVLAGFSWVSIVNNKPRYSVQLATSAGELQALEAREWEWVHRVSEAVGEAIVARG